MAKTVSDLTHTGQVNSFTGGLNTDLHPLVQPNDTLTDCINGTLITYNGNENMLQNDMGNYALEGSELPDGFIPLGMKEHNGVAYIVSQNPMTKEVQIGSYPSPEIINTEKDPQSLKSEPIPMTIITNATPYPTDYSYDNCVKYWCVESRKVSETSYTEFDVELNFGDSYAISPMENLDFQYEQFAIKEKSGKITNINPIVDGEMHTVDWTSCGQLLKKYVLNKVVNFTQDVEYIINDENKKTRVVGVLPDPDLPYNFIPEDFDSITINNTVKFDRIDVIRESNDDVLVGIMYKVITGNPKKFALYPETLKAECTATHNVLVTVPFEDNKMEYEFSYTMSKNDPKHAGFMYFLRYWSGIGASIISGDYLGPIDVQSYPILIHRVNGKDKSVLLYDEHGSQTYISELDIKGDFIYQYYTDTTKFTTSDGVEETIKKLHLRLDGLDKTKNFLATRYTLQKDGNLMPWDGIDTLTFYTDGEYNTSDYWEGGIELYTDDDIIFFGTTIFNQYYIFPVFTSIDKNAYNKYVETYNDFCLIPGDLLLEYATDTNIRVNSTKINKFVKINNDGIKMYDNCFHTSVYANDNKDTYYGDVECADLVVNNYSGNKVTIELQKQISDDLWSTINKQTVDVINSSATFKNCIVSANVQSAIAGNNVSKCLERVYLAKNGHAPFAHSEDISKRTPYYWQQRFIDNSGFTDIELFNKLVAYGEWNDSKKTLHVDKHCGKRSNEFVVTTCDIYGKSKVNNSNTYATTKEWQDEFDKNQLFVPVTFNVNCDTSYVSIYKVSDDKTFMRNRYHHETFSTILANGENMPVLIQHENLLYSESGKPEYHKFDKWLLYLYTHAFYCTEKYTSGNKISLIKRGEDLKLRYIVKGDFNKSFYINGVFITDTQKNILQKALLRRCYNFNFSSHTVNEEQCVVDILGTSKQWDNIDNNVQTVSTDSNKYTNSLYCDVYIDNAWSSVGWGYQCADINYSNCCQMFSIDIKNLILKSGRSINLSLGGNKSAEVELATTSSDWMGFTPAILSKDVQKYDFSPWFKQIIDYDPDY